MRGSREAEGRLRGRLRCIGWRSNDVVRVEEDERRCIGCPCGSRARKTLAAERCWTRGRHSGSEACLLQFSCLQVGQEGLRHAGKHHRDGSKAQTRCEPILRFDKCTFGFAKAGRRRWEREIGNGEGCLPFIQIWRRLNERYTRRSGSVWPTRCITASSRTRLLDDQCG